MNARALNVGADGYVRAQISGDLDVGNVDRWYAELGPHAEAGHDLLLDVTKLRFCGAIGLSLFARLDATGAGGSLRLNGVAAPLRRLLVAAGLERLTSPLPVQQAPTAQGAVAARQAEVLLGEVTRAVADGADGGRLLAAVAAGAVSCPETIAAVAVACANGGRTTAVAAAPDARMERLAALELSMDQGPCVDAVRLGRPVLADDLAAACPRWHRFAPAAVMAGLISVRAVPIHRDGRAVGAIAFYGGRGAQLAEPPLPMLQTLALGVQFAALTETVHAGRDLATQLQSALDSRVRVEQAKGIVAHAGGLDMEGAFAALRRYSRRTRTPIGQVADRLVSGALEFRAVLGPRS